MLTPRILEPPCRGDSKHPFPKHPLSLRARSPARVQMEIGLGRVKLLDIFIWFLLLHLLMSLSPSLMTPPVSWTEQERMVSCEPEGSPHAPRRTALGRLLSSATRTASTLRPLRVLGGREAGRPAVGQPQPTWANHRRKLRAKPPFLLLFLLGRSHGDGEVGSTTPSPPGTEHGCY